MPPVFGPRSPSNARLWSCAVPIARQILAVRQHEEARLLAVHELLDDDPRARALREDRVERRLRLGDVAATVTPLPAASPSALTTIGAPWAATQARAASGSVKV